MFAFQRRGLAFDLVGLLTWPVHVEWTNKLYRALTAETAPGFNSVSLIQLIRADRELFTIPSTEYQGQGPLKAEIAADPPLDDLVKQLMIDPRINIHLTPMPSVDNRPAQDETGDKDDKRIKKKPAPKVKTSPQVPDEPKGLGTKTKDGKPICWHYNLTKGCGNPLKNGRCRFGFHICMRCGKKEHGCCVMQPLTQFYKCASRLQNSFKEAWIRAIAKQWCFRFGYRRTSSKQPLAEDLKPSPTVSQNLPGKLHGPQASSEKVGAAEHVDMSNHDKLGSNLSADEFSQNTNAGKSWWWKFLRVLADYQRLVRMSGFELRQLTK